MSTEGARSDRSQRMGFPERGRSAACNAGCRAAALAVAHCCKHACAHFAAPGSASLLPRATRASERRCRMLRRQWRWDSLRLKPRRGRSTSLPGGLGVALRRCGHHGAAQRALNRKVGRGLPSTPWPAPRPSGGHAAATDMTESTGSLPLIAPKPGKRSRTATARSTTSSRSNWRASSRSWRDTLRRWVAQRSAAQRTMGAAANSQGRRR